MQFNQPFEAGFCIPLMLFYVNNNFASAIVVPVVTMRSDAVYTWDDGWLRWNISLE